MNELKTEPLTASTETPEAAQPAESANAPASNKLNSPASSLPAIVRKSPGKLLLYGALIFFGLLALDFLAQIPRWLHQSHVRRVQRIVDTITPDGVLARCGQPLEDVTTDLYPMMSRRMTFNSASAGSGKVVLFFSRTSEENSQWLYSSMREEGGTASYNTPDEQMAALPCLATTK
jgi:hypothetical protein